MGAAVIFSAGNLQTTMLQSINYFANSLIQNGLQLIESEHLIELRGLWNIVTDSLLGHRPDREYHRTETFRVVPTLSKVEQEGTDGKGLR